mgnify:CR=1 FL=1
MKLGDTIPDFQAINDTGQTLHLSDYQGKTVLLYFYPKDNTSGCTTQAQFFRDHITEFSAANIVVLGVSRDSVKSHQNFKAKHELSFTLIADTDETLCQLFDVIKQKIMYGKQVRGIERSSFLISPERVLLKQWRKVNVKKHGEELLAELAKVNS